MSASPGSRDYGRRRSSAPLARAEFGCVDGVSVGRAVGASVGFNVGKRAQLRQPAPWAPVQKVAPCPISGRARLRDKMAPGRLPWSRGSSGSPVPDRCFWLVVEYGGGLGNWRRP